MNLDTASPENIEYILNEIGEKLAIANRIMIDSKAYDLDKYDDLLFLYRYIVKQNQISPAEKQALLDELRAVRKT